MCIVVPAKKRAVSVTAVTARKVTVNVYYLFSRVDGRYLCDAPLPSASFHFFGFGNHVSPPLSSIDLFLCAFTLVYSLRDSLILGPVIITVPRSLSYPGKN